MRENDPDLRDWLNAAQMDVAPRQARAAAVREHMLAIAGRPRGRLSGYRTTGIAALVVLCVCAVGLAATQSGRALIRRLFVPISESHMTQWVAPDGGVWSQTRTDDEAYTPDEQQRVADTYDEIYRIKQAGGGRLLGLMENPGIFGGGMTIYRIEYELSNGEIHPVGSGKPSGQQAEKMRIDEIQALRDAGEGEVLSEEPSELGLGRYVIRFTLSDGATVDLETIYPPGTRDERGEIFARMWRLKSQRRFTVERPYRVPEAPEQGVWGILRYTLADGRVVGTVEQLPADVISEDGQYVTLPESDEPIQIEARGGGSE